VSIKAGGREKAAVVAIDRNTEALAACRVHKATLVIAKLDRLARNVAFVSNATMERLGPAAKPVQPNAGNPDDLAEDSGLTRLSAEGDFGGHHELRPLRSRLPQYRRAER
jgi:hypothetical protein